MVSSAAARSFAFVFGLLHCCTGDSSHIVGNEECVGRNCETQNAVANALLQVQSSKSKSPTTMDQETDKHISCIVAGIGLATDAAGIAVEIINADKLCKSGDADGCAKVALDIVKMFTNLVRKIISDVVPRCNGGQDTEGLQCAKDATDFVDTLTMTATKITDTIKDCKDSTDAIETVKCIDIASWVVEATSVAQQIADIVTKCKKGCVVDEGRLPCNAPCEVDGTYYTGIQRVEWIVGNTAKDLRGAVLLVNEECCASSRCSMEDFPHLSDCDKSCFYDKQYKTCKGRVQWVVKNADKSVEDAMDIVNGQCDTQCSCVVSDLS